MPAPFTDQGEAAVCARVALALIRLERHRRTPDELQPLILIGCTLERLHGLQLHTVRLALLSLSVWVGKHKQSSEWLKGVLMRDYFSFSIRTCFFAEYKENRRGDPRVTNRGVTTRPSPASSQTGNKLANDDRADQ